MISENITLEDLYKTVVNTLCEVNSGEIFIVRDLFRGFEWNRIPKSFRTKLGFKVFAYSNSQEGSEIIKALDKTPQNQQKYIKL